MEKVLAENETMLIIQNDSTKSLDTRAKKKLGDEFMVAKAFDKKEKRFTTFLLYCESEPIIANPSIEGIAYEIDKLHIIIKSQEWER